MSANIVPGSLANDLATAREIGANEPVSTNPSFAKGALVAAAIAPGLAPYAGARVGIGNQFEAGLAYTGRAVRADMRRSFGDGPWNYSIGLGGSAALYGRQQGSDLPNVEIGSLKGYGFDVPLLAGWESPGGIYKLWFGGRGGFEHINIERLTTEPKEGVGGPIGLDANRFFGGGVVGMATGFNHVHVALEASVSYQVVTGTYNQTNATVRGITIAPATALWWTF